MPNKADTPAAVAVKVVVVGLAGVVVPLGPQPLAGQFVTLASFAVIVKPAVKFALHGLDVGCAMRNRWREVDCARLAGAVRRVKNHNVHRRRSRCSRRPYGQRARVRRGLEVTREDGECRSDGSRARKNVVESCARTCHDRAFEHHAARVVDLGERPDNIQVIRRDRREHRARTASDRLRQVNTRSSGRVRSIFKDRVHERSSRVRSLVDGDDLSRHVALDGRSEVRCNRGSARKQVRRRRAEADRRTTALEDRQRVRAGRGLRGVESTDHASAARSVILAAVGHYCAIRRKRRAGAQASLLADHGNQLGHTRAGQCITDADDVRAGAAKGRRRRVLSRSTGQRERRRGLVDAELRGGRDGGAVRERGTVGIRRIGVAKPVGRDLTEQVRRRT